MINGRWLRWMTWEDAYEMSKVTRLKTLLAVTRCRARSTDGS